MRIFKNGIPALQVAVETVTLSAGECRFEIVVREQSAEPVKPCPLYVGKFPKVTPGFARDREFDLFAVTLDVARNIEERVAREFLKVETSPPARKW